MSTDHAANDLGLSEANGTRDCGQNHAHDSADAEALSADLVKTHLAIDGMTCGHCVASVTEELSSVAGIQSVDVRLNAGGTSQVTVTSTAELDPTAVLAAIDEAGYTLVEA